jgi:hypothetical protein
VLGVTFFSREAACLLVGIVGIQCSYSKSKDTGTELGKFAKFVGRRRRTPALADADKKIKVPSRVPDATLYGIWGFFFSRFFFPG